LHELWISARTLQRCTEMLLLFNVMYCDGLLIILGCVLLHEKLSKGIHSLEKYILQSVLELNIVFLID
jgi:hypothetical protein